VGVRHLISQSCLIVMPETKSPPADMRVSMGAGSTMELCVAVDSRNEGVSNGFG
jgi:hypothetical protein